LLFFVSFVFFVVNYFQIRCAMPQKQIQDVLVVGAGLAGLTAAYELQRAGWGVTVCEAQSQVGGRVKTVRSGFAQGQWAEAGAEFIDAPQVHPQIHHYISHFQLGLEPVARDGLDGAYYLDQQRFGFAELSARYGNTVEAELERFRQAARALGEPAIDLDQLANQPEVQALDGQSIATWLDQLAFAPVARRLVDNYLRDEFGEPDHISLLTLAHDATLYGQVAEADLMVYRIQGGNDRLPAALAEALHRPVQLNTPITAISLTENGVQASHAHGELTADYLILAAPLPALRRVVFTPALPSLLTQAITDLSYATHVKVLLQYSQRFWQTLGLSGEIVTDLPLGCVWEATGSQAGTMGILVTYTSGCFGEQFEALEDAQRIKRAVAELEAIYPGSYRQVTAATTYAWNQHPYIGGAFSMPAPGQLSAFWGALRQPHGRLYFAGEHTDAYFGYMEGAIRSGQRVAQQLVARAKGFNKCDE
jgi:monoamine oxidase